MTEPKKLANGDWVIRPAFKDPITGKWHQKYKTFSTKTEARMWANKVIQDAAHHFLPNKTKLGEYYDIWFKRWKTPGKDIKTLKKIKYDFARIFKFFGRDILVSKIDHNGWQDFLNWAGSQWSRETVKDSRTVFSDLCEHAINDGLMFRNPTHRGIITGIEREYKNPRQSVLTMDEFKCVVQQTERQEESISKMAVLLSAYTGMRYGEIAGLTIPNVNIFTDEILVEAMYDANGIKDQKVLKQHAKPRTIVIPHFISLKISDYVQWLRIRQQYGEYRSKNDYMFPNSKGIPITDAAINKYIAHRCKECGITRITSHGFRRTQATLMELADNDLKYIAQVLGHRDTRTTVRYYLKDTSDISDKNDQRKQDFFKQNGLA